MRMPFPHHYQTTLTYEGGRPATITAGDRPVILGGPPPEFDGDPALWSPEHLLLASLNLCLQATFEAYARRKGLRAESYRSRAAATLGPVPGGVGFTHMGLVVEIQVAEAQEDAFREVMEKAKRDCIIAGALAVEVHVAVAITTAAHRPHVSLPA
jgi:organic hydroperoxide reductase OsmC/OhrA